MTPLAHWLEPRHTQDKSVRAQKPPQTPPGPHKPCTLLKATAATATTAICEWWLPTEPTLPVMVTG